MRYEVQDGDTLSEIGYRTAALFDHRHSVELFCSESIARKYFGFIDGFVIPSYYDFEKFCENFTICGRKVTVERENPIYPIIKTIAIDAATIRESMRRAKAMRHDNHYRRTRFEPIEQIESTFEAQIEAGVPAIMALNIAFANKYIQRAGIKEGQAAEKDIQKAVNYLNRAIHKRWLWEMETNNED